MIRLEQDRKAQYMNQQATKYGARSDELVPYDAKKAEIRDPTDHLHEMGIWRSAKLTIRVEDSITKISTDPDYFRMIVEGFPVEITEVDQNHYLRGMVATENIESGRIILAEEPLLAATFDRDRCAHCTRPLKLEEVCRCPKCTEERYCSEDCAKQAAEHGHEQICGYPIRAIQTKLSKEPSDYMEAATILMFKLVGYIRATPNFPCDPSSIRELRYDTPNRSFVGFLMAINQAYDVALEFKIPSHAARQSRGEFRALERPPEDS